jgi:hypothetical protein
MGAGAAGPDLKMCSGQSLFTSHKGFWHWGFSQLSGFWQGYRKYCSHPAVIMIDINNPAMANDLCLVIPTPFV